jgi:hypothetical protein
MSFAISPHTVRLLAALLLRLVAFVLRTGYALASLVVARSEDLFRFWTSESLARLITGLLQVYKTLSSRGR